MRQMKKQCGLTIKEFMAMSLFIFLLILGQTVSAKELPVVTVHNDETVPVVANVSDTGKIVADPAGVQVDHYIYTETQKSFDEYGQEITNPYYNDYYDRFYNNYNNDEYGVAVLQCNEDGTFEITGKGTATIYVYGYNAANLKVFSGTVTFTATYDMTDVTVATEPIRFDCTPASIDEKGKAYYYSTTMTREISVTSPFDLTSDLDMSCETSTSKYTADVSIVDGKLSVSVYGCKEDAFNITLTMEGKQFVIPVVVARVTINTNSYLLPKKKTKQLKITNYTGNVIWSSTDKKIATVSETGKVTGKKYGNCVIIAKLESGVCLGCAVSVTTPKLRKVCTRAEYIGRNWKYSQPLRMKTGYYDCSALVWKSYMYGAKLSFGNATYAGTTATESAWCKSHGRMIKGGYKAKKLYKLQVNPGDIVFKSTNMKNKYGSTYHVEMFTGYTCYSVSEDGSPSVSPRFGARDGSYAWGIVEKSLFARPLKY